MQHTPELGSLEVICGPMFSGKTKKLIELIQKWQQQKMSFQIFKHALDTRFEIHKIVAHSGESFNAQAIGSSCDLLEKVDTITTQAIAIDEIQFFDPTIYEICAALVRQGKQVVVAGLDLDFRGEPFGAMPLFLSAADVIHKTSGTCCICGERARFTQRMTHKKPACRYEPLVIVASQDRYEARCWNCYEFPGENCCQNQEGRVL